MELQAIIVCDKGAAQATTKEAARHNLTIKEEQETYIIVTGSLEQLSTYTYYAQSALDVLIILEENSNPETINKELWSNDAKEIIKKDFAIRAQTKNALETNKAYGKHLDEQLDIPVNLNNPTTRIVPYTTKDTTTLTVAITNKELKKREYRVFTSNTSLRATIAASTLYLAGYTGEQELLVPYETDGTLSIEAAMIATKKSPHHYEGIQLPTTPKKLEERPTTIHAAHPSVQHLKASQKNAKIAGVLQHIQQTKAPIDWLDTKYDENQFDILIANLPSSSKKTTKEQAQELAKELLYQAKYLLKKTATLALISTKPEEIQELFTELKKKKEHTLYMGEQKITLLLYEV